MKHKITDNQYAVLNSMTDSMYFEVSVDPAYIVEDTGLGHLAHSILHRCHRRGWVDREDGWYWLTPVGLAALNLARAERGLSWVLRQ